MGSVFTSEEKDMRKSWKFLLRTYHHRHRSGIKALKGIYKLLSCIVDMSGYEFDESCLKHIFLILNLAGRPMTEARPAVDSQRVAHQDPFGSSS
jgi:hypothetical protein